jgi:starvation-inducible outer membrane lipoprotein
MKKACLLFLLAGALALAGCATLHEPRSPQAVDTDYVGAVERKAARFGGKVQWVNPPRRARAQTEETTAIDGDASR